MPNQDLLRIVDGIARDKNIERDAIYTDIEQAIASGFRKHFNTEDTTEFTVRLDRQTGDITASRNGEPLDLKIVGRIGAQTVKQVLIQLVRQDERGSIYEEFKDRVGTIITGTVARFEGPAMIVSLGRVEGIMPRSEQIPGEQHQVGERVQALVLEVRDTPSAVKIILSRSHPELIRRLFEREVPEVGERTIELKALAREPGHRTKIAVSSIDSKVDAVGACVGVRGSRIKNIVDELGGEKIDIVRWNESSQILISNALKPAEVAEVSLCFELGRATVVVNEDQLSLAIGKRGQNVRLAARLTGWDIDILTPPEFQAGVQRLDQTLKSVEGITQEHVDKIIALGLIDVRDIEEVGEGPLMEEAGLTEELAAKVLERCAEEAKVVAAEQEKKKAEQAAAKAALLAGGAGPDARREAEDDAVLRALGLKGVDGVASGERPLPQVPGASSGAELPGEGEAAGATTTAAAAPGDGTASEEDAGADAASDARMPDPMESVPGAAPEVIVHKERPEAAVGDELSPEERAVNVVPPDAGEGADGAAAGAGDSSGSAAETEGEGEAAALAEGRVEPPKASET